MNENIYSNLSGLNYVILWTKLFIGLIPFEHIQENIVSQIHFCLKYEVLFIFGLWAAYNLNFGECIKSIIDTSFTGCASLKTFENIHSTMGDSGYNHSKDAYAFTEKNSTLSSISKHRLIWLESVHSIIVGRLLVQSHSAQISQHSKKTSSKATHHLRA